MYAAQYISGDGEIIDEIASADRREVEKFVRRVATHIVIVDDARYGGDGDFVPGELRWFEED